jgi:signal transduction histidine kinase
MNDLERQYVTEITVNKYNFEITKEQKERELDGYRISEDYQRNKRGDVFGTVKIIVDQEGIYGKIIMEDDGVGMADETMKRMYDPGFTEGKPEKSLGVGGTGFGLTAVKQCVDDYQGEIFCESKKGVGTRFILSFPKKQSSE